MSENVYGGELLSTSTFFSKVSTTLVSLETQDIGAEECNKMLLLLCGEYRSTLPDTLDTYEDIKQDIVDPDVLWDTNVSVRWHSNYQVHDIQGIHGALLACDAWMVREGFSDPSTLKIQLIKQLRSESALGLKEAKMIVEDYYGI